MLRIHVLLDEVKPFNIGIMNRVLRLSGTVIQWQPISVSIRMNGDLYLNKYSPKNGDIIMELRLL